MTAGGLPDGVKISGPYESRDQLAGTKDGQYGFFRRADGAVMACAWSSAAGRKGCWLAERLRAETTHCEPPTAGVWTDVGTLDDGDAVMSSSGDAAGGAAAAPPGGKQWDYVRGVTMDTAQGMRSLQARASLDVSL